MTGELNVLSLQQTRTSLHRMAIYIYLSILAVFLGKSSYEICKANSGKLLYSEQTPPNTQGSMYGKALWEASDFKR